MARIDLNADVAESPDDLAMLDVVTSANVCCGAYAGSEELMLDACRSAVTNGVAIGAQVGYADREGFGRRAMEPESDDLIEELRGQIDLLAEIADLAGGQVVYVKPHGALYNTIVSDERQARAVVDAVLPYGLPLLGLRQAVSLRMAVDEGLGVVPEGFADRAYRPDGTLVPRTEPGAVLDAVDDVTAQAVRLVGEVGSICVHGDSPGALNLARAVRRALEDAGHELRTFA